MSHAARAITFLVLLLSSAADTYPSAVQRPAGAVHVVGASDEQRSHVLEAVARYEAAGFELPPTLILVHDTVEGCDGSQGLFHDTEPMFLVEVCGIGATAHELAHAWEAANVDGEARQRFLDHVGNPGWNDHAKPWSKRGVEQAAGALEWGTRSGLLTEAEAVDNRELLLRFYLLTGKHSLRYPHSVPEPPADDPTEAANWAAGYSALSAVRSTAAG